MDEDKQESQEPQETQELPEPQELQPPQETTQSEEGVPEEKEENVEEEEEEKEDDEDEDGVEITIEDVDVSLVPKFKAPKQVKQAAIDLEAGNAILDLDLNSLEDKPWRKPGADLSDYFNYGFDEDTWKSYCELQKKMRGVVSESRQPTNQVMPIPTIVSVEPRNWQHVNQTAEIDRYEPRPRDRSREREREKTRDRERKDRDRGSKTRERDRDREKEKVREKDRTKDRDRDRHRESKKRERSRERDRDKKRKRT